MPYVTSVERIGIKKGIEEGIEKGERALVSHLLKHKFGELPDRTISQIDALSIKKNKSLSEALLDFSTIVDLEAWLAQQSES